MEHVTMNSSQQNNEWVISSGELLTIETSLGGLIHSLILDYKKGHFSGRNIILV